MAAAWGAVDRGDPRSGPCPAAVGLRPGGPGRRDLPGRGHDLFRGWLARLATFLVRKAIYSLILAVLLAVVAALQDATGNLGWLLSFGLQALFLWAVFLYRHQLTAAATSATTGHEAARAQRLSLPSLYWASRLSRALPGAGTRSRAGTSSSAAAAPAAQATQPGSLQPEAAAPTLGASRATIAARPESKTPTSGRAPSRAGGITAPSEDARTGDAPTLAAPPASSSHHRDADRGDAHSGGEQAPGTAPRARPSATGDTATGAHALASTDRPPAPPVSP